MSKNRESNFEVLRTVAMFFIVVYHCLTHGVGSGYTFSAHSPISLTNFVFSDFMLVFSSISVNIYVMISGYFLCDLNFKASRIVRTWLNACFYCCLVTVLFMCFSLAPFSVVTLGKSFAPISTDAYWFVTQYIGLLILSPFLSLIVRNLSYRQYVWLLIGGAFICLAIIPDFPLAKRFHVAHGNSVWSFAYLFFIAGFVRHHLKRIPMSKLLVSFIIVTLITMAVEIYYGSTNGALYLCWLDYNGLPFVLSVIVFVMIKQTQFSNNWLVNILVKAAPYTFGVYLIHDHLMMRDWLWTKAGLSSFCNQWAYPLVVIGLCVLIFLIGVLVDSFRKRLFDLLKVNTYMTKLDTWASSIVGRL